MPIFDVQHQSGAHRQIQRALASERLPHAYVFHGPDGVGKEMLARRLAQLLLCEKPREVRAGDVPEQPADMPTARDACGCCRSCHLVDVGNHPDLHLIYRQLNAHHPDATVRNRKAMDIGVDVVRHFVIAAAGVSSACGRAKVFLIREADRMTTPAQNALLKTLEEPPPTTFLILLATSFDRLLSTTRSRCQLVRFSPLPADFVADKLGQSGAGTSPEDARLYAALGQGSLGRALRYAEDDVAAFNRELVDMLGGLRQSSAAKCAQQVLEYAKESAGRYRERDRALSDTAARREALRIVFVLMATWYRDLLHTCARTEGMVANVSVCPESAADTLPLEAAAAAITSVNEAERQLHLSVNVQLCIESLMFKLADLHASPASAVS